MAPIVACAPTVPPVDAAVVDVVVGAAAVVAVAPVGRTESTMLPSNKMVEGSTTTIDIDVASSKLGHMAPPSPPWSSEHTSRRLAVPSCSEAPDVTDGFLSHHDLLAPYRHVARLPTKDVRVHFLRALVAWMPLDLPSQNQRNAHPNAHVEPGLKEPPLPPTKPQSTTSNSTVQFESACSEGGRLHHLCNATRVLHTVSLLYDDIQDDSDTRRGEPCAHIKYGVPWTLNAASAATFAALHELAECAADAAVAAAERQSPCVKMNAAIQIGSSSDGDSSCATGNGAHQLQQQQQRQDRMLSEARELWADVLTGRLTRTCTGAMRKLHSGQGKDIWYRDTGVCPTMAEYELLCVEKTGGLFRLIAEWVWALHQPLTQQKATRASPVIVGGTNQQHEALSFEQHFFSRMLVPNSNAPLAQTAAALSPAPTSPSVATVQRIFALCDRLGLCFQILDDYLNLCDDGANVLKGYCEDLQEGKFSFLVTHAVWSLRSGGSESDGAEDKNLIRLLQQRPRSRADKDVILSMLHETKSFDAAVTAVVAHCEFLMTEVRAIDADIFAAAGASTVTAIPASQRIVVCQHQDPASSQTTEASPAGVLPVRRSSAAAEGLIRLIDTMRIRATGARPNCAL